MDDTLNLEVTAQIQELINQWETVKTSSEKEILDWETKVLKTIFPYRFDNIDIIINDMVKILSKNDKFWCPGSDDPEYPRYFSKFGFNSFMDYFTRKLSVNKNVEITEKIKSSTLIIPNECYVESIGEMKDVNKILSLKKSCDDVKESMGKLGLILENYSYVNHKLLLTFYHRIHSPVSGIVERIIPYPKENGMFGDNALWILDINTGANGYVYLMLVGESEIQDFHFLIKEGQHINKFDEIGNFNWGSQTVLFYDNTKFTVAPMIKPGSHYFVGDKIF